MPELQQIHYGSPGVGEKSELCSQLLAQQPRLLGRVDADGVNLHSLGAEIVDMFLELSQLLAAEGSPVAPVKDV